MHPISHFNCFIILHRCVLTLINLLSLIGYFMHVYILFTTQENMVFFFLGKEVTSWIFLICLTCPSSLFSVYLAINLVYVALITSRRRTFGYFRVCPISILGFVYVPKLFIGVAFHECSTIWTHIAQQSSQGQLLSRIYND